jgi:hypothetical protein
MTRNIALVIEIAVGVAAVAAAIAITSDKAFADDITIDNTPFVSSRSRAEVQAEIMKTGGNDEWTMQFNQSAQIKSAYTREEARAEYVAARNEVTALNAEDSGSSYLGKTRAGVNPRAIMGAPAR